MGSVRDMVYGMAQVADDSVLTVRPSIAGEEWSIHNIYVPFNSDVEIYRTDGTNSILVMKTNMSLIGQFTFHCNEYEYLTVKNISGGAIYLTFDGTVTRVS